MSSAVDVRARRFDCAREQEAAGARAEGSSNSRFALACISDGIRSYDNKGRNSPLILLDPESGARAPGQQLSSNRSGEDHEGRGESIQRQRPARCRKENCQQSPGMSGNTMSDTRLHSDTMVVQVAHADMLRFVEAADKNYGYR